MIQWGPCVSVGRLFFSCLFMSYTGWGGGRRARLCRRPAFTHPTETTNPTEPRTHLTPNWPAFPTEQPKQQFFAKTSLIPPPGLHGDKDLRAGFGESEKSGHRMSCRLRGFPLQSPYSFPSSQQPQSPNRGARLTKLLKVLPALRYRDMYLARNLMQSDADCVQVELSKMESERLCYLWQMVKRWILANASMGGIYKLLLNLEESYHRTNKEMFVWSEFDGRSPCPKSLPPKTALKCVLCFIYYNYCRCWRLNLRSRFKIFLSVLSVLYRRHSTEKIDCQWSTANQDKESNSLFKKVLLKKTAKPQYGEGPLQPNGLLGSCVFSVCVLGHLWLDRAHFFPQCRKSQDLFKPWTCLNQPVPL